MNSPNYPPPGGPQGQPYGGPPPQGPPPGQGQPYGQRPPQTPPGGQSYGGPPPQGPPQGQPYGGPPPGGQNSGGFGPPPGGPGGAPPAAYPTPPPPATKPKRNTFNLIKIGLVVVVVAVGGVLYFINKGTAPSSSKVGDCIKVNTVSSSNADIEKIDCNSQEAAYKVAATFDDSSAKCKTLADGTTSSYVEYTETGRGSDLLLCLTLNVKEGDCFIQDDADKKVACTDPSATYQVSKLLTGSEDPNGCPEGTVDAYVYPEPALVQCFAEPAGTAGT